MAPQKISIDDFEVNQTIREMQRLIMDCAKGNKDLELTYSVEAQPRVRVSRTSRKFLLKVDLLPRPNIFCKIKDVLEMDSYIDRAGILKAWDDHRSHTSVLRTPGNALDELSKRMSAAVGAYARRRYEFDDSRSL